MITKTTFLLLLVIYVILFFMKTGIVERLTKDGKMEWLTQTVATNFFYVLLVVLIVIGVLFTENAETQFANVSAGFEQVRSGGESDKPHRYFDINLNFIKGNE